MQYALGVFDNDDLIEVIRRQSKLNLREFKSGFRFTEG